MTATPHMHPPPGTVLIAGLGSIGRRHLRNLQALGCRDLLLYRTGHSTLPDTDLAGLRSTSDLEGALAERPIAVVIANPTALHLPVALAAARAGCHLFIEKPVSHTLDGIAELEAEVTARRLTVLVGFNFRFHRALRLVKSWIEDGSIGRVVSVVAQWGEYLPGWHPWENHRTSYSGRADLGGGVVLTMCHPFDYLRWLIGEVHAVGALTGQASGLDIDVEDTAHVLLQFDSGTIGTVQLDYVQNPPSHVLRITGTDGLIECDVLAGIARRIRRDVAIWEAVSPEGAADRNTMFNDEMAHFLTCLTGAVEPAVSLHDGVVALEICLASKTAAVQSRMIEVRRG